MKSPVDETLKLWRERKSSGTSGRVYSIYVAFISLLFLVSPAIYVLQDSVRNPTAYSLFELSNSQPFLPLLTGTIWIAAITIGPWRGPLVLPPFLAYAYTNSAMSLRVSFSRFLIRSTLFVFSFFLCCALLFIWGIEFAFDLSRSSVALWVVAISAVTAWTVGLWLWAQSTTARTRLALLLGVLALLLVSTMTTSSVVNPIDWLAVTHPQATPPPGAWGLPAVLTLSLVVIWYGLGRVNSAEIMSQSTRWDSASALIQSMDLATADSLLQQPPASFLSVDALGTSRYRTLTLIRRDAVGASRGLARSSGSAVVMTLGILGLLYAVNSASYSHFVYGFLSVLVFLSLKSFTSGFDRVSVSEAGLPIYGMPPSQLIVVFSFVPLFAFTVGVALAFTSGLVLFGPIEGLSLLHVLLVGALSIVLRAASSFKGYMPVSLLSPIPTPFGDISVINRFLWSIDGVVMSFGVGVGISLGVDSPMFLVLSALLVLAFFVYRWRRRAS